MQVLSSSTIVDSSLFDLMIILLLSNIISLSVINCINIGKYIYMFYSRLRKYLNFEFGSLSLYCWYKWWFDIFV